MEKKMEEMKKMKKMIHKIDKIQKKKMHNYLLRQLTEAVAQNNFGKVEELLKNGADVSIIGNGGMSALSLARLFEPRYIGILKRYSAVF